MKSALIGVGADLFCLLYPASSYLGSRVNLFSVVMTTLRMPKRSSSAAENGPTSPYRKMPMEITLEIPPLLQPNSSWNGMSRMLGSERMPAETSKVAKVSSTITQP